MCRKDMNTPSPLSGCIDFNPNPTATSTNRTKHKQLARRHHKKSKPQRPPTATSRHPPQQQPLRTLQRRTISLWQNTLPHNGKSQLFPQKRPLNVHTRHQRRVPAKRLHRQNRLPPRLRWSTSTAGT